MNISNLLPFKLIATVAAVLSVSTVIATAQTITAVGKDIYPSTTPAPGSSSDYYFVDAGSNLNDFSLNIYGSHDGNTSGYASTTLPDSDTVVTPSVYFTYGSGTNATFQLTNAAEPNFTVNILVDNANPGNGVNGALYTLSSNGADATDPAPEIIADNEGGIAEYLTFDVTGATTSDVFTISAQETNGYTAIGGVTFSADAEVPEPTTWALLLGGVGFLVFSQRALRVRA